MRAMVQEYCPQCAEALQPESNFCSSCGAATAPSTRWLLSMQRVILLTTLSGGLYFFWWFYITWKQYQEHTGEDAFPVWHALTLLVPIYGLFRVHAHVRTFRELMTSRDISHTLRPGLVVVAVLTAAILSNAGLTDLWGGEVSKGLAIWLLIAAVAVTVIDVWIITAAQINLNRYWSTVIPGATAARVGKGEVTLTVIGALLWIDTIAMAFSDSWRTM